MRMRTLKQLKITFSCFCKNCYRLANATVDILWLNIKATKHFFKHEQSNVHTAKITDTEVKRCNTLAWLRFFVVVKARETPGGGTLINGYWLSLSLKGVKVRNLK